MTIFLKLIISVVLLVGIINPRIAWMISEGWKFKNAEPSEVYLLFNRIMAIVILIVIWLIFPG
ncbi:DUF6199 family natural product biosynthesis protein [Desulfosporosinus sp. BG]|uniref:DUF6199 family natural product biosynthesis protein n=1 Tax=Desulfosporosinus sp. BG TaxID=1633135 RepID=UPI00083A1B95